MRDEGIKEKCCCFFGHRNTSDTEELKRKVYSIAEKLVSEENISIFLFGSKSQFDSLCYKAVTELKEKHPHIKRILVRAEYPYIDENYKASILKNYEDTYFPEHIVNAGRASYIERNFEMIDKSDICVVFYDANYVPKRRSSSRKVVIDHQPKSGTSIAYKYALNKNKTIINTFG